MTDILALEREVLTNPFDDTVRLAYADCLQENAGDVSCRDCGGKGKVFRKPNSMLVCICLDHSLPHCPWHSELKSCGPQECSICRGAGTISNLNAERAEFIRVQCEISKSAGVCEKLWCDSQLLVCDECKRWKVLRKREQELLFAHARDWFRDVVPNGTISHWSPHDPVPFFVIPNDGNPLSVNIEIRRGFIDEVRLPLAVFAGRACPRCNGYGVISTGRECCECGTAGGSPGLASELFARHPITRVVLSDVSARELDQDVHSAGPWALAINTMSQGDGTREKLRVEILDRRCSQFISEAQAMEYVSYRSVNWARSLPGVDLPPLNWGE